MKTLLIMILGSYSLIISGLTFAAEVSQCEQRIREENDKAYRRHQNRVYGGVSGTTSTGSSFYIPNSAFSGYSPGPYENKRQTILNLAYKDPIYFKEEERRLFTRFLDRVRKIKIDPAFSAEKFQKYIQLGFKKNDFCAGFKLFGENNRIVSSSKALSIAVEYIKKNETLDELAIDDSNREPSAMFGADGITPVVDGSNSSNQ